MIFILNLKNSNLILILESAASFNAYLGNILWALPSFPKQSRGADTRGKSVS